MRRICLIICLVGRIFMLLILGEKMRGQEATIKCRPHPGGRKLTYEVVIRDEDYSEWMAGLMRLTAKDEI